MFNKNKKATDIAPGEYLGILVTIFVIVIFMLIFYGCSVFNAKETHEAFVISKEELEAIKDLNFFLEMPIDGEKNVLDLVIESFNNDDYGELHNLAKEHFSKKYDNWGLIIEGISGRALYNSISYGGGSRIQSKSVIADSEVKIPILEKENEITVVFQIREK